MIRKTRWGKAAWLLAASGCLCATTDAQAVLTITDVGRFDFTDTSGSGAREISGLVLNQGTGSYFAIGDKDPLLHSLILHIDPTGQVAIASFSPTPITLSSSFNGDREGIAIQGDYVLTANEEGPQLESFDALTGASTGTPVNISTPGLLIYGSDRPNRSWESLTNYPVNTSTFLTANEDALTVDGPAADFTIGAVVRIQSISIDASNSTATAIGQFAYQTDAINGDNPFASGETSGLVELLALPDGNVLAMERAVGLSGYRIRIYQIGGDAATDISGFTGLAGLTPNVDYTPVSKTLLWENTFSVTTNSNFEGLALGRTLDDGRQSLMLVADNASGPVLPFVGQQWTTNDHSLYALTIGEESPGGDQLTGDLDEDGFVGISDLNLILSRWNEVVFPGSRLDRDANGFVGISDLNTILANWNAGTPPTGLAAIPEPATAAVTGLLSVVLMKRTSVVSHR